jgi:formiminotetrahydrofolate cyclodeaminase
MQFTQLTLDEFLNRLASGTPTPGGGTTAALAGALGASLVSMVAGLTIGKKGYESAQAELVAIRDQSDRIRGTLTDLMDEDSESYERVIDAMRLPRGTEAERSLREEVMQEALEQASLIPYQVAVQCNQVLGLARLVADRGNKSAASDAGVGALLADAGIRAAVLNIEINLKAVRDEAFVIGMREKVSALGVEGVRLADVLSIVERRM